MTPPPASLDRRDRRLREEARRFHAAPCTT